MCQILFYTLDMRIKQDRQAVGFVVLALALWLSQGKQQMSNQVNKKDDICDYPEMGLFNIGCLLRALLRPLGLVSEQKKNFFSYRSYAGDRQ